MAYKLHGTSTAAPGVALMSLVAAIASTFATQAHSLPLADGAELSARVSTLATRLKEAHPALARELKANQHIVQWRN
jgi:hypothetical protein